MLHSHFEPGTVKSYIGSPKHFYVFLDYQGLIDEQQSKNVTVCGAVDWIL